MPICENVSILINEVIVSQFVEHSGKLECSLIHEFGTNHKSRRLFSRFFLIAISCFIPCLDFLGKKKKEFLNSHFRVTSKLVLNNATSSDSSIIIYGLFFFFHSDAINSDQHYSTLKPKLSSDVMWVNQLHSFHPQKVRINCKIMWFPRLQYCSRSLVCFSIWEFSLKNFNHRLT